jgi:hypothetical protein
MEIKNIKKTRKNCTKTSCIRKTSNDIGLCSAHRPDVIDYRNKTMKNIYNKHRLE